ncbi:MAG: CoA transferase [Acidobacteriota bacterium]|nr:MAG: CoA transferase [Acidobacteriota bacterium]
MRPRTVLSMEQALALSYGTLRLVHLGWRVIRLEAAPRPGEATPGDPNRYVGRPAAGPDRRSYFLSPNVGKEAVAIDLKHERGRQLVKRIVRELPVDVFACNTLPKRYEELGIDFETLSSVNPKLIWVGISAMGPEQPDMAGYDPMLQALLGYMDLTGDADGPPTIMGVPMIDLKAGDEMFAQTMRALAEQAEGKAAQRIDVSMARAAASWLHTTLPLLDLGAGLEHVRRSGNEHREFVPVNVYQTSDSWLYLAIGNDVQWRRLVSLAPFESLARQDRDSNEGRKADRDAIHAELADLMRCYPTEQLLAALQPAGLVAAPVHSIADVRELAGIREHLTRTRLPDEREVRLPPAAIEIGRDAFTLAPGYGQHTRSVLEQAGLGAAEIDELLERGVVH